MPRTTRSAPAPTLTPSDPEPIFRCRAANLGAYFLVATKLVYRGAQLCPNGSEVDLLFADPERSGPDLQRRFNVGLADLQSTPRHCWKPEPTCLPKFGEQKQSRGLTMPSDNRSPKQPKESPLWSRARTAHELSVDTQTVDKFIRHGWLVAHRLGDTRTIRIERQSVMALLKRVPPCK